MKKGTFFVAIVFLKGEAKFVALYGINAWGSRTIKEKLLTEKKTFIRFVSLFLQRKKAAHVSFPRFPQLCDLQKFKISEIFFNLNFGQIIVCFLSVAVYNIANFTAKICPQFSWGEQSLPFQNLGLGVRFLFINKIMAHIFLCERIRIALWSIR